MRQLSAPVSPERNCGRTAIVARNLLHPGKDKVTIHRAMKDGRLSYAVGANGARQIDPAELERVFRIQTPDAIAPRNRPAPVRNRLQPLQIEALLEAERSKIAILEDTVADLRTRLNRAESERRQAQEKLTAILADQRQPPPAPPARRSWWRWRQ